MPKQFSSDIVTNAYQQESQLIAQLYANATEPDALIQFMHTLIGVLHAQASSFADIKKNGQVSLKKSLRIGFDPHYSKEFDEYYTHINVFNHRLRLFIDSNRTQKTRSLYDMISAEEHLKTEIYNDWSKKQNLRYGCFISFNMPDSQMAWSINRSDKQGIFQPEEMAFIDHIAPHITNVLKIQQKFNSLDTQSQQLTAALYNGRRPYLLFDHSLNVIFTNKQAETLFRQSNALTVSKGKLKARYPHSSVEIRKALTDAVKTIVGDSSSPDRFVRVKLDGQQGLLLHVSPISVTVNEPEKGGATLACASIEIYFPNQEHKASKQIMEELFALTPAEARLARYLSVGKSLQEIEKISNTSMNTLKTHLKGIFRKTDTSRQPELVAKLSNLPCS